MWPLLQRELRAEARRPLNRWLRVGTAAVFFILLELSIHGPGDIKVTCQHLFPLLHAVLLSAPWLVAPLLMAEVLTREKQEGTLELLLLTPLTLSAVLWAKTVVLAARTAVLVIGALPIISFTVLFGGVGQDELLLFLLLQASSLTLALGIALFAAAWGRTWLRALAWAASLVLFVGGVFAIGTAATFQGVVGDTFASPLWSHPHTALGWIFMAAQLIADGGGVWSQTLGTIPRALIPGWFWLFGAVFLSALLTAVSLGAAARVGLRRSLHASAVRARASATTRWWRPGPVSRRRRRSWLRANPVRWLMRYPGETRLFRWLGAAAMTAAHLALYRVALPPNAWFVAEAALGMLTALGLVLAAAGSFRRERDEGGLEMLMVTPLSARQFTRGRLAGLWWQFAPVFMAWMGGLLATVPDSWSDDGHLALLGWIIGLFLTIPGIGLEAAFQFRTYWRAVCATAGVALGVGGMLFWVGWNERAVEIFTVVDVAVLGFVALLCGPGFELRLQMRRNGENIPQRRHRSARTLRSGTWSAARSLRRASR